MLTKKTPKVMSIRIILTVHKYVTCKSDQVSVIFLLLKFFNSLIML